MSAIKLGSWELDNLGKKIILDKSSNLLIQNRIYNDELTLDNFLLNFHDLHQAILKENINNLINLQKSFEIECSLKSEENSISPTRNYQKWVRITGQVLETKSNRIGGLIEDISEFKMDLTKLQNYWNVLDQSNMISITNISGRITYVNDNLLNLTGFKKEEIVGKTHSEFNSGFHPKSFFKNLWETILSGVMWEGEILNKNKNGKFQWIKTQIFPILDFEQNIVEFISIRQDINDKKKKEQEALDEERIKSINEVSNQIIHELMSPLNVLSTRVDFLEDAIKNNELEKVQKNIDSLKKSSSRVIEIFKDMRSLLREEKVEFSELNFKDVLRKVLGITHSKIEQYSIAYSSEIESRLPKCLGSTGYLEQVIVNLVNNSCDAIKNLDEKWISLRCYLESSHIIIEVTDSGLGIPSGTADKIFDYLYTTKKDEGGSGLGLALSRRMIEKMNGKIELVKNAKNTCFRIYLPKVE